MPTTHAKTGRKTKGLFWVRGDQRSNKRVARPTTLRQARKGK